MPSIISGFEYDIFISYRQKDNKYDRWVTEFVANLKKELEATFKEDISIYFDTNPHDGLLETHNVDKSLEGKLKCLIFIPIISQTYCDIKSFAWQHEFCAFNKQVKDDQFGRDINLSNGNVASRILPIKIHDLDAADKTLLENELGGLLRAIEFIYKSAGVNRPLNPNDERVENLNHSYYRDQVNKVANAVKEIIAGLKNFETGSPRGAVNRTLTSRFTELRPKPRMQRLLSNSSVVMLVLLLAGYFIYNFTGITNKLLLSPIEKSIAVLPFENLSGDPAQEYFSDGIAEEILNSLAQIKDLKVPGRTSSFQFKGKAVDLQEVGKKLKVSTVLEGSVRKQGNHIRITAKLINVDNGYHLWSQQFDRTLDDVLAIQEEIAMTIVQKLKVTLLENEKMDGSEGLTTNKQAYDAYLKGRFYWNRRQVNESAQYYKQAIELDSSFALAYAGLAESYVSYPIYSNLGFPDKYMPLAQKMAEKVIRLNSSLSEPYAVLGYKSFTYDWNAGGAEKYFEKSMQLNPKSVVTHYWYGLYLSVYGADSLIALDEIHRALELDPLNAVAHNVLGIALRNYKRYDEAIESFKAAIEINPQFPSGYVNMGICYLALGKDDEALKAFLTAGKQSSNRALALAVYCYIKRGNMDQANTLFAELIDKSKKEYVSKNFLALAAFYLGKKEMARVLLKEAYEEHDVTLVTNDGRIYSEFYFQPDNIELRKRLHLPKGR